MLKLVATPLWFLVGWTVTAMAAIMLNLPGVLAPVGALATAAFVWFDPARLIWPGRQAATPGRPRLLARLER